MKAKYQLLLWFFILPFLLFGFETGSNNLLSKPDSTYYLNNPVYGFETSMYKLNKLRNPDIVMFGDSHIQGAQWSELLGNYKVINRGVAGDDTYGMKKRLPDVVKLNPKIVVIEGGINDVYNWVSNQTILNNIEYIIKTLKANQIKVIVTSVFFAGKKWGENWIRTHNPELDVVKYNKGRNEVVKQLNWELKKICRKNNVRFLDLIPALTSRGFLKDYYTRDQLHLNAKGYKIWAQKLNKILIEINKKRQ